MRGPASSGRSCTSGVSAEGDGWRADGPSGTRFLAEADPLDPSCCERWAKYTRQTADMTGGARIPRFRSCRKSKVYCAGCDTVQQRTSATHTITSCTPPTFQEYFLRDTNAELEKRRLRWCNNTSCYLKQFHVMKYLYRFRGAVHQK